MKLLRPYKSDLYRIEKLVELGCHESDICKVLNITSHRLNKWREKSQKVDELLKVKPRPEYTLNHPEYAPLVEEVFTCAGKRYYRFKDEYRMSTGRYKYYYDTLKAIELKLSLENLQQYIDAFEKCLNGTGKKKEIRIGDLWILIINLKSKVKLAFDVSTVKKLAAIAYFDDTEDLTSFNEKYGDEKIKIWEENNQHDFFLTRRIGELLNVKGISDDSFQEHLAELEMISNQINFNLRTVLEDSFSENGRKI